MGRFTTMLIKQLCKSYTRPQLKNKYIFHIYRFIESRIVRDPPFIQTKIATREVNCLDKGMKARPYTQCLEPYMMQSLENFFNGRIGIFMFLFERRGHRGTFYETTQLTHAGSRGQVSGQNSLSTEPCCWSQVSYLEQQ